MFPEDENRGAIPQAPRPEHSEGADSPSHLSSNAVKEAGADNTATVSPSEAVAARSTSETPNPSTQPPAGSTTKPTVVGAIQESPMKPGSWLNTELDHFVRTVTRPILTIGGAVVWVWFILAEVNYPPALQWLIIACWLEWFGERAVKRLTELGVGK